MELIGTLSPVPAQDGGVMAGWLVFVVAMAVLTVLAVALQLVASWIHRGRAGVEEVASRRPRAGTAS